MSELTEALRDLQEDKVHHLVDEMLQKKVSPLEIINQCNEGISQVGEKFASKEYFLTELMFSAEIMQGVLEKVEPYLETGEESEKKGTVVIGTVKNDIHDIGKNIVTNLLSCNGFKVVDMGVDVPPETFVEKIKETGAKVLGLSALLNTTYPEMKNVVDAVKEAGIKDRVTVIIGGNICSEQVREYTGADYYARDAVKGVNICKEIYQDKGGE